MEKRCIAGCGRYIYEDENWVCPYYSKPEEWNSNYGPCGCDLVVGTNECLYAPIFNCSPFYQQQ